ncbi:MAG: hypothetical protein JW940_03475 [Polyangiaceae bacterium]|nr:hypothetical protein [Polyangiaceae bacterium]
MKRARATRPDCRATRIARRRGIAAGAKLALCIYALFSLGAPQLLAGLHYRYASHGHRFCPEHGAIEDIPASGPNAALALASTVGTGHAGTFVRATSRRQSGSHTACAVLNTHLVLGGVPPAQSSGQSARQCGTVAPELESPDGSQALPLLALAPKRSPPLSRAS